MNEELTQKDRSPRSPTVALEEAIETTRKLYQQARTATIKPEVAVKALGYNGTNGAAMTTLATLAQYGLVDRAGGNVAVTPLAVKIFHPTSPDQKQQAIYDAAQMPAVFRELLRGFEDCSADVVMGHLIQNRFTPDRAKKVAQVYVTNKSFARPVTVGHPERVEEADNLATNGVTGDVAHLMPKNIPKEAPLRESQAPLSSIVAVQTEQKVLAQYSIPLGENQATLVFTGGALTVEDFDALADFVEFAKKQFVRKMKGQLPSVYPKPAIWQNADFDKPVMIVGELGERDGSTFFQSSDGSGIPSHELLFE